MAPQIIGGLENMLQTNGSSSNGAPGASPNTVSWQSAYWALIAVAFTVLVQNAGMICGLPSYDRIIARSSPIICLADVLLMIIKYVWLLLLGCSPRVAARHVWYDRFENPDDRPGSGIDRMWWFSMICFVVGGLPQTIKIFGMQGIPGTQIWTAVFFAAFITPEVLRVFAGVAQEHDLRPMPIVSRAKVHFIHIQDFTVIAAGISQYFIWTWVMSHHVPLSWFYTDDAINGLADVTGFYFTFAYAFGWFCSTAALLLALDLVLRCLKLLIQLFDYRLAITPRTRRLSSYIVKAFASAFGASEDDTSAFISTAANVFWFCSCFLGGYFGSGPVYGHLFSRPRTYTPVFRFLIAGIFIPLGFIGCHLLFRIAFMGRYSSYPRRLFGLDGLIGEYFSIFFFIMNALTSFIYYSSIYDAIGTYKPSWTDKFG